jgi:hypothetical protein
VTGSGSHLWRLGVELSFDTVSDGWGQPLTRSPMFRVVAGSYPEPTRRGCLGRDVRRWSPTRKGV